jgi:hypothetical protein
MFRHSAHHRVARLGRWARRRGDPAAGRIVGLGAGTGSARPARARQNSGIGRSPLHHDAGHTDDCHGFTQMRRLPDWQG